MESRAANTAFLLTASGLAVAVLWSLPLAAEDDPSLFFDTVDVYVVNVEVIVTDKDGHPVTGLRRQDFEVREDGERVELTNFFAVEGREPVAAGGASPAGETAPTPETTRLNLVVFVDDLNIRPRNRNLIFKNLRSYLKERLDPRDRVMLVAMNDTVEVAQSFTNDLGLLLEALDGMEKRVGASVRLESQHRMLVRQLQRAELPPTGGGGLSQTGQLIFESAENEARTLAGDVTNLAELRMQQLDATLAGLGQFTSSLAGMRGRKAVLYVSDGLPVRPADSLAQAWLNKYSDWALLQGGRLTSALRDMMRLLGSARYDASSKFRQLTSIASANRVVFYPISNAGRMSAGSVSAEFAGAGTTSGQGPMSQDVMALESQSLESSLLRMAADTGGVAFTRSTNIGGLLDRVAEDFDTFYSLGYTPPHATDDEYHEVQVKVLREGLEVRHLEGYREKDPLARLQDLTLSALHYGLEDNRLGVRLVPGNQTRSKGNRYVVDIMVQIPFKNLLLLPQEESHTCKVSLFAIVRDQETGGVSPFQRIDLPIEIPNAKILEALNQVAAYPLRLNMKKGPKRISIGVRDHLADTDATVCLELNVGESGGAAAGSTGASDP